jgi:cell division protein FtsB
MDPLPSGPATRFDLNLSAACCPLSAMNSRQVIVTLYVVLLSGLGLGASAFLYDARTEYQQLKATETALRAKLAEKEAQLKEQQRILDRLKTDHEYVERVIRKRLNYVKQGEVVFRFPEE